MGTSNSAITLRIDYNNPGGSSTTISGLTRRERIRVAMTILFGGRAIVERSSR